MSRFGRFIYEKTGEAARVRRLWALRERSIEKKKQGKRITSFILRIHCNIMMRKYGCCIPYTSEFANKPCFPHQLYGIFVSKNAKIGKNAVIFQQVTIGSNTIADSKGFGSPTIGDNVYIGCGAKIIGNAKIGNNVRIGANCVVTCDIPDNTTVVLPKPVMIPHSYVLDNTFKFPE